VRPAATASASAICSAMRLTTLFLRCAMGDSCVGRFAATSFKLASADMLFSMCVVGMNNFIVGKLARATDLFAIICR
jgi:hypothetical protein